MMIDWADLWQDLRENWHKYGVLFLVLRELKFFYHTAKFVRVFVNLRTPEGRANFWKDLFEAE